MPKKLQPPLSSNQNGSDMAARRLQTASAPLTPAHATSSSPGLPPRRQQAGHGSSATATGQKARSITEGSRALKGEADSFLASLRLPPAGNIAPETGAGEGAKTMHDKIELMRQQIAAKERAARGASPQSRTQQTPASGNGKAVGNGKAPLRNIMHVGVEASKDLRGQDTTVGVKRKAAQAAVGSLEDPSGKKIGGAYREPVESEAREVGGGANGTQMDAEVTQQEAGVTQATAAHPQPACVPLAREETAERQGVVVSQGSEPPVLDLKVRGTDLGPGVMTRSDFPPATPPLPAWASTANQLIQEGLQTVRAGYAMATSGRAEQHHMMSGHPGSSLSLVPPPSTPPIPRSWEEIQREEDAVEDALDEAQQRRRSLEVREALARRQLREATQALRAVEDECFSLKRRSQALAAARITAELQEQPPPRPTFHPHVPAPPLTLRDTAPGDSTPPPPPPPPPQSASFVGQSEVHGTLPPLPEAENLENLAPKEFTFDPGPIQAETPSLFTSTSKDEADGKGQRQETEGQEGDALTPATLVPSARGTVQETSISVPAVAPSSKKERPASQAAMIAEKIRRGILQKRSDILLSSHSDLSKPQGGVKRSGGEGEEGGLEGAQLSKRRKSIRNKMMAEINAQDPSAVWNPTSPDESRDGEQAVEAEQPLGLVPPATSAPIIEDDFSAEFGSEKVEAPAAAAAASVENVVGGGGGGGGGSSVENGALEPEKEPQDTSVQETSGGVLTETAEAAVVERGGEDPSPPHLPPSVPTAQVISETAIPSKARESGAGGDVGGTWMPLVYFAPAVHLLPPLPAPPPAPIPAVRFSEAERDGEVMRRYRSPLSCLRSWRLSPRFPTLSKASPESLTWNNCVDPMRPLCKFELRGICNDDLCPGQHRKSYQLPSPAPETPAPTWWLASPQPKAVEGLWEEGVEVLYSIEGQVMRSPAWDAPTLQACVRGKVPQTLRTAAGRRRLPKGCVALGGRVEGLVADPQLQEAVSGRYYDSKDAGSEAEGWEEFVEEALHCTDCRLDSNVPSEARNKAICTLVRFLEVSPKAPVPWVLYLLLYRGADGAQGSPPSHIHNLCKTAVRYNGGCYELWSFYCSVDSSVEQSIGVTEEAIAGLVAHSKEEASVLSAQALSLCLQLLQRCCIAGAVETACSWLAHLLTAAERPEDETQHSAFLRCLVPGDHAVLWISAAYLAAQHRLPPPVTRTLGCHQPPLSCCDLDWYGKGGPRPESAQVVTRIFGYACGKELEAGPTTPQAQLALAVNEVQYVGVAQGAQKAHAAANRLQQRFGSSPELLMLQAQCNVVNEGEGEEGREQRRWLSVCQPRSDSTRDGAAGEREGGIEGLGGFWVVMREGLEAAMRGEEDKGRGLTFKAFRWAMEGDSVSLQRVAVRQLAGLIHRSGETAQVQAVVEVLTWLSASKERWNKFTGCSRPLSSLSCLAREGRVQSCLRAAFERAPRDPWMLNQLCGDGLNNPQLGLVDFLQDLCPGNVTAIASCVKEQLPPGTASWLAGLLIAALWEEQSATVAGSRYDTWAEVERGLQTLNQKEAASKVRKIRAALHCFSLQRPMSVPPVGQNGVSH